MDTLLRFGYGDELYSFDPDEQVSLRDNFREVVPRISRLPGMPGGFDEYGDAPAPEEIGNVQAVFWLRADTPGTLATLKAAAAAMEDWGRKSLWKWAYGEGEERFCKARVNSIDYTETSRDQPHKRLRVQVNFQADPVWHSLGTYSTGFLWGDGTLWGSGAKWGGTPVVEALTGADNSFSVTPGGNKVTYPRITVTIPAGKSAEDLRIQRWLGGRLQDEIFYEGTLDAGDVLDVDVRKYRVKLNWASGYVNAVQFASAAWFRLRGGRENVIRVRMVNATDEATVSVKYLNAFNY